MLRTVSATVECRVEFEDVVVDAHERAAHLFAADLRGVAQHGDLRRRAERVAQGERVADDGFELGMHRGFSVACEGDDVGRRAVGDHAPQRLFQQTRHVGAGIETAAPRMFGIPAAFAVDAVERTELRLGGQQVDAQRKPQPARVHGTENDVVVE